MLVREKLVEFAQREQWYHSIELADGVVTRGQYDYRPYIEKFHFGECIRGRTVLDVGAADGFFSFHFESLRATSVTALEVNKFEGELPYPVSPFREDHYRAKYAEFKRESEALSHIYNELGVPVGNKLLAAKKILGSNIAVRHESLFDFYGDFPSPYDVVFCGSVIEHLKNPVEAVEILRKLTKEVCVICLSSTIRGRGGRINSATRRALSLVGLRAIDFDRAAEYVGHDAGGAFFHFTAKAFKRLCLASGFSRVEEVSQFGLQFRRHRANNLNTVFHCVP